MTNKDKIIRSKYVRGIAGNVTDADYFYYETAPDYNESLAIVCGGYEKCAPDFEINRSDYPYCFIICTIKGKGMLEINGKSYELRPGNITGFSPGTPHHYIADPKDPMEHIFITFVGTEAEYLLKAGLPADTGITKPSNPSETVEIIEKIFNIGMEKNQYSQQICCSYLRILMLQQRQDSAYLKKTYSRSKATYMDCKRYIDDNFSNISSIHEVARYCGINPRYMSTLFKRHSQNSPLEYIMRLKMNKAGNMLLATSLSVKEIAYKIGFNDPYHFSRNFKKFHNTSPTSYRSKHM